jgi:hypothetical protein
MQAIKENALDQLKTMTTVVADSGDFECKEFIFNSLIF